MEEFLSLLGDCLEGIANAGKFIFSGIGKVLSLFGDFIVDGIELLDSFSSSRKKHKSFPKNSKKKEKRQSYNNKREKEISNNQDYKEQKEALYELRNSILSMKSDNSNKEKEKIFIKK